MPDNRDEERRRAEQVGRSPLSTLMGASRSGLTFTTAAVGDRCVLTVYGVLDDTTYIRVRDAVINTALDEYRALIIDVTRLAVASPSAWSVFTTARSHIAQRSDIPMTLVCGTIKGQKALRRNGISRDIPVYWRVEAAIAALPDDDDDDDDDEHAYRRRAHAELSPQRRWLERWPTIPLRTGSGGPGQLRESR
jgi:hypothetical protein